MLSVVAFGVLYLAFIEGVERASRNYQLAALAAFLLFLAASTWNMLRNERNKREYLKSEGASPKLPSQ
jgi:hypothetical protein